MHPRSGQLKLPLKPKHSHGGRRPGAGRPNRTGKRGHLARPRLDGRAPVHVTLKLQPGLPSFRKRDVFRLAQTALYRARARGLGVVHFAILSNHIHLICEPGEKGLRTAVQSFTISFSKKLNRTLGRRGEVFLDRYHMHVLHTPTEVRNAIECVLTNQARHELRRGPKKRGGLKRASIRVRLDSFSSAYSFAHWNDLLGPRVQFEFSNEPDWRIEAWHNSILARPRTWLLKQGWRRAHK